MTDDGSVPSHTSDPGMDPARIDRNAIASLHVWAIVAALFASAAWALSFIRAPHVRLELARWWALGNLATLSAALALALLVRRRSSSNTTTWMESACVGLELIVSTVWAHAVGDLTTYLVALPALLILLVRLIGGASAGLAVLALAIALELGFVTLEAGNLIEYAPVYVRSHPAAAAPEFLVGSLAGVVSLYVGSFLLAAAVARSARTSRQKAVGSGSQKRARKGRFLGLELGKYRLGALLGRGGMGEVYAARRSDGAEVALKILHPHLTSAPNAAARFFREVEALARLPKARVARIFDFGSTPAGVHYIVMERLLGEDLATRLRRVRRLPIADVLVIVEQIASVLDAAADLGIVHRDVKPRNIYLVQHEDGRMDARLLDFGVCRLLDAGLGALLGRTAALLGTPGYLAPEQIAEGFGEIGPHTDVFALAAVAYRALSGENAFPSRKAAAAVYEALNHHPPAAHALVPELPDSIDAVLCLALAKKTAQRYARASQFSADLRAAAAGKLEPRVAECASALSAGRTRNGTITSAA